MELTKMRQTDHIVGHPLVLRPVDFRAGCVYRISKTRHKMLYNDRKARNLRSLVIRNIGSVPTERKYDRYAELIEVNNLRLVDSCFVIYDYSTKQIMYISEIACKTMNPNFNNILVPIKFHDVSKIAIKVWIRHSDKWKLYLHWDVDLRVLVRIDGLSGDFGNNAIIIALDSRYYTLKENIQQHQIEESVVKHPLTVVSYKFDTIRSINNLDKSIKELETSKKQISRSIDKLISNQENINNENILNETKKLSIRIGQLNKFINQQNALNDGLLSKIINIKIAINKIKQIKEDVDTGLLNSVQSQLEYNENQVLTYKEDLLPLYESIKASLKDKALAIGEIFKIDSSIIMDLQFPSSISDMYAILYENAKDLHNLYELESDHMLKILQINSVLSVIVQILAILIKITNLDIHYKMKLNGNFSTITDFDDNEFPLFYNPRLTKHSRNEPFERGLGLLNKNLLLVIHQLNHLYKVFNQDVKNPLLDNIPIDCLDNFLWNLEYIILFMTASA